jgi:transcription-repair coupling factor (superfamily II helicase)
MRERELESVMRDFYHQRFNILLCTTIIESGIDVPSANTIIINKADRFGLAQLHQLRGRVGRSHHQAYAYMISPPRKLLTGDAAKRLAAIEALDDLGAGFALASQDLEIRGAGELLGESQSGMIDEVGYSLYSEFLAQAIQSLGKEKGVKRATRGQQLEIDLNIPARFPDDYIPDVHLRLTMYKRISGASDYDEIQDLAAETIDRFGLLPEAARNLFNLAEVKLQLVPLGITAIDAGPRGCKIKFGDNPDINMDALVRLIAASPNEYAMRDPHTLQIVRDMESDTERIATLVEIAGQLAI